MSRILSLRLIHAMHALTSMTYHPLFLTDFDVSKVFEGEFLQFVFRENLT